MNKFDHRVYLSDGRCLTGAEFERDIATGKLEPSGYVDVLYSRDLLRGFEEKQGLKVPNGTRAKN